MEEDIKVLEDMRDEIYGAMDFEDDYQVRNFEQKQFDALNLAIKHLRKTKLIKNNYISKDEIREEIKKLNEKNSILFDMYTGKILKTKEDYQIAILRKLLKRGKK